MPAEIKPRTNVYNEAMKVLVAGGSGFIGRYLSWRLREAGHEVLVLTRGRPPALPGVSFVRWDAVKMDESCLSAAADCEAWINLCGAGMADGRWSRERKTLLRESRLAPTRALVFGLTRLPAAPKVLISASAVGFYGDAGDRPVDEAFAPRGGFLSDLCSSWEKEASQASALGVRTVCLRLGAVLARDGGMLGRLLPLFRLGLGGTLGGGRQWLAWISRDDLAGLIGHLLTAPVNGAVNAVSPRPVTNREFARTLGAVLGRPSWLWVPGPALRLALGEMAGMLLTGQRAVPKKALESGFSFQHADLEAALRAELF